MNLKIFKNPFSPFFLLWLIIIGVSFLTLFSLKNQKEFVDEVQHYTSIKEIATAQITNETFLRNAHLPGYFLLMGGLGWLTGWKSLWAIRVFNTLFSFLAIMVFILIAQKINPQAVLLKTLEYFFFPLFFLFFFLVYNDVFSLALILLSFYFLLINRPRLSGIFGFFSLLIRQNNLVWLGFLFFYFFFFQYDLKINFKIFKKYLKETSLFLFSFAVAFFFIIINKGATIGEGNRASQPISFHLDNLYFLLFLFFFLFLPLNLRNIPKILALLKKRFYLLFLLPIFFFLYLSAFKVTHPWNGQEFNFFLRNALLNFVLASPLRKTLFFIPVVFSFFSLIVTPLSQKIFYLLYPFTFFFLGFSWLVEPRYYLIPLTFFLLFKKEESLATEYLTIILYLILTTIVFFGTMKRLFFL